MQMKFGDVFSSKSDKRDKNVKKAILKTAKKY